MALEDVGDGYSYDTETGEFVQTPVDNTTYKTPGYTDDTSTTETDSSGFKLGDIGKLLSGTSSYGMLGQLAGLAGTGALLNKVLGGSGGGGGFSGYQGGIPTLTASRQMLPIPTTMQDSSGRTVARRPGSGGVTYFSPIQYLKPGETPTPVAQPELTPEQSAIKNQQPISKGIAGLPDGFWNDVRPIPSTNDGGKQQLVAEDDPFYQSPQYKDFQKNSANQLATMDMYNSPYFGSVSSGSVGRDMDKAYEQYKGIAPRQGQSISAPFDLSAPIGTQFAAGGIASLGSYSDGGRLLRGPGDGVSDSIPATIGNRQPARLADGEFVVPARIVSELGNGSTEAGARKLYAMMDRIKASRAKAKNIAADTKAYKHLPA